MEMARDSRKFFWAYTGLILAFVYLPLVVIIFLSFNNTASIGLPFIGFSLQWYYHPSILANGLEGFLQVPAAFPPFQTSVPEGLSVATMSNLITVAPGLPLPRSFRGGTSSFISIPSAF